MISDADQNTDEQRGERDSDRQDSGVWRGAITIGLSGSAAIALLSLIVFQGGYFAVATLWIWIGLALMLAAAAAARVSARRS
jgi:ABC-type nickel/cobalt efflux system permease component RcnA